MSEKSGPRFSWILMPAAITLAIVLLRLFGELYDWSPTWFGKAAGGGVEEMTKENPRPAQSIFGIFWLMPLFGIWFGWKLRRSGASPDHRGKALLFAIMGFAILSAGGGYFMGQIESHVAANPDKPLEGFDMMGYAIAAAGWIGVALVFFGGWRDLVKLQFGYALFARIPIIVLTIILIPMNKGTHFEKPPPFAPEMDEAGRMYFLCLPQIGFWVPLTILVGTLFGTLTTLVVPAKTD